MTKTITIFAQKGGSGKTTTALTLARYIANQKNSVILIDTDPQQSAYKFCPADIEKVSELDNEKLFERLKELHDKYEYIVIDTAPVLSSVSNHYSLLMSDLIIVPVVASLFDVTSAVATLNLIKEIRKDYTKVACLQTMRQKNRVSLTSSVLLQDIVASFKNVSVLENGSNVLKDYKESAFLKKTILNTASRKDAEAYCKEILEIVNA